MDNTRCEDSFAICPWCNYRHQDSWEMVDGEHECAECRGKFFLDSDTTTTYHTKRIEPPQSEALEGK